MNLPKTNFTVGWTQTFDTQCTCLNEAGMETNILNNPITLHGFDQLTENNKI